MSAAYEALSDFSNLYAAHRAARRGKSRVREVAEFELNLAAELCSLSDDLQRREYRPGPYTHFLVHEPKVRSIYALGYRDRVLQHCLCDQLLAPALEPRLIYDNAACRVGKGSHFALCRLTRFLTEHYRQHRDHGYFLKADIRQYFASVRHKPLKKLLAGVSAAQDVSDLLSRIIDSYHTEGVPGSGIPLGNQTSQWFGLLYLDGLDRLVKEKWRVKHYTRYMDDMVLLLPSRGQALAVRDDMARFAEADRGLAFNAKTQVSPVRAGVKYLGWHFYLAEGGKVIRKLVPEKKARMRRAIRSLPAAYRSGELGTREVTARLASYAAHLDHGHTHALRRELFSGLVLSSAPRSPESAPACRPDPTVGFGRVGCSHYVSSGLESLAVRVASLYRMATPSR